MIGLNELFVKRKMAWFLCELYKEPNGLGWDIGNYYYKLKGRGHQARAIHRLAIHS